MRTMCLYPDCKTNAEFGAYADYTSHLKKTHKLDAEQCSTYIPTTETVRLHPRPRDI